MHSFDTFHKQDNVNFFPTNEDHEPLGSGQDAKGGQDSKGSYDIEGGHDIGVTRRDSNSQGQYPWLIVFGW